VNASIESRTEEAYVTVITKNGRLFIAASVAQLVEVIPSTSCVIQLGDLNRSYNEIRQLIKNMKSMIQRYFG
jgi:predicted subunit of tRNA(5-methylaminomethyl-2-thiouridylate) methyltransferase